MNIEKHIEHIQKVGVCPNDAYMSRYIDTIEEKFQELNLDRYGYIVENEDNFSDVFGYKLNDIEGFKWLSEDDKQFVLVKGIYQLINNVSLEMKPYWLTYKVEKHPTKYKLYTGMGYSWLHLTGKID